MERTRLLLHVVDISGCEGRDPIEDFEQINYELKNYGELAERPQIVVCNKMDITGAEENLERMKEHVAELGWPVFSVSAAAHQGFDALLDRISQMLDELPPIQHFEEETIIDDELKPDTFEAYKVIGEPHVYEVSGSRMQRLIDSINFDDEESLNYFHRTLRRLGVIDALRKAGAGEGDIIRIADMEFDFIE